MHKANTYYDEEQPYSFENSNQYHIEKAQSDTEKKGLSFFETGINIDFITIKKIVSFLLGDSTGFVFYFKTALSWICGLEKSDEQSIHSDNHPYDNTSISSILKENISTWHKQCSYAAIILLSFSIFVWAFFTDYRIRLN
jgi:hypothetical protein